MAGPVLAESPATWATMISYERVMLVLSMLVMSFLLLARKRFIRRKKCARPPTPTISHCRLDPGVRCGLG